MPALGCRRSARLAVSLGAALIQSACTREPGTAPPAAAPAKLAFVIQPAAATAGGALTPAIQVALQDARGRTAQAATATIVLTLGANPGDDTLTGTTTEVAVQGVATFANLILTRAATGYTLVASASGLTSATSAAFDVTHASPARLVFSIQPTDVTAGYPITPPVRVLVQDSFRNVATSAAAGISVTLEANPTGDTLLGTTSADAVQGEATFTTLILNKSGVGYTLNASGAGVVSASSQAFSVLPLPHDTTECTGGMKTVALLVDQRVRAPLMASLQRFAGDLCAEGYTVWLAGSVPASPPALRSYLADAWSRSQGRLTGAMLIGDIPHAYQHVILYSANPSIPNAEEEVISFQYYEDVDGQFAASQGYSGYHRYSFDVHSGDVNWELWIGVLPVYKGSVGATVDALTRYFEKNHAYRTGAPKPPRAFIQITELLTAASEDQEASLLAGLRDGIYSWTPFSTAAGSQFYFDGVARSVLEGYDSLRAGVADFAVVEAHGSPQQSGQLTIASVETQSLPPIFFWSDACAVGNLDWPDNFLTAVLYSPTSSVLVAKGTTNNSGGMGTNANGFYGHNVAAALSAGASFGEAILAHVNAGLIPPWSQSREFHFATSVVLGDPTLLLRQ